MKLDLDNFWVRPVLFCLIAGLIWLLYSIQPLIRPRFLLPKVTVNNPTPCMMEDRKPITLENFVEGTPQYICGDMITDTSPVNLTLVNYPSDFYLKSEYVTSSDFKNGAITFTIDPPLPPGKYRALIQYARTTFADIYFDVKEK